MKLLFTTCIHFWISTAFLMRGDILISEVLFNPKAGGVDFVEIYNHSGRAIDLKNLYIGSVDRERKINNILPISKKPLVFYPGKHLLITTDPKIVQTHYPNSRMDSFIAVNKLPNYNNNDGTVILLYCPSTGLGNIEYLVLDSLHYTASMHSPFLKDVKGISLERVDFNSDINLPGNFRSAAFISGGATPGYENSAAAQNESHIRLRSQIVSPGGYQDELELHYKFSTPELIATVLIYDINGSPVRTLIRHKSIPSKGVWKWDGTTDGGQPAREGIYTVFIELYNRHGFRERYRKSFVVVSKK